MKKVGKYLFSIAILSMLFTVSYYLSYKQALQKLGEQLKEQNMNSILAEHMTGEEQFAALNGPLEVTTLPDEENENESEEVSGEKLSGQKPEEAGPEAIITDALGETKTGNGFEEAVVADTTRRAYILPDTRLLVETYELSTGEFNVEEKVPDAMLVGLTREELQKELQKELDDMPISEYEKGLISNELITFSEEKVIVRRTYDKERVEYLYYLAVKNGEVVVYYSDRKTVYEYTGIAAATLAEEERLALMSGIPVQTAEEMFALLESYSS